MAPMTSVVEYHCMVQKVIFCLKVTRFEENVDVLSDVLTKIWPMSIKPNYFLKKKQRSSSSFLLTWSRHTSPKWPWSLTKLVPCLKWMELGCQLLLGHFGPVNLLQVSKNDNEEQCLALIKVLLIIQYS